MQTFADMAEKQMARGAQRVLCATKGPAADFSLAGWLEGEGFEVITAIDGQEALQISGSSWQPDVVLLDLTLPKVNVLPVFERVRAANRTAVIFVLSGDPEADEVR